MLTHSPMKAAFAMWRNRKLPVVTTVILVLNLLGLIYVFFNEEDLTLTY